MSLPGSLLCQLRATYDLAETRFSVEKSKVSAVKAEASAKFLVRTPHFQVL